MATENAVMAVIKAYRPCFRNPHDKIAFAVHSAFLASGCTLIATGPQAFSESILSSPPSDEVGIEGWNETDESYGFVYSKNENNSKNTVLVKCLIMGDHLVIDAICSKDQDKEPLSLQINVNEFDGGNESTNYEDRYKQFAKLVKTLNSGILSKMEDSSANKSTSATSSSRSEPRERSEQNPDETRAFEPYPPLFNVPLVLPGHNDDLFPGPGAGIYPRGGPDMGGPMLIGPNDPRWFRSLGEQPEFPGGLPGVPRGARFDPYGPPGVPGFEPNHFARNPRRPGTHPDLEHFGNPDFI